MCNIVNRYSDGKYNCIARASPGPVANIDRIMAGAVQFGMSRSDYVWSAVHGTGIWEDDAQPGLRALFTVHNVAVTLVVRDSSEIYLVTDLAGRRVNLGIPESFGQQNAVELLERSGLDVKDDIEPSGLLPKEAARALAADEIDAFFVSAASPDPAIALAAELTDIRLLPLSSAEVIQLVSETPWLSYIDITTGHYRPFDPLDEVFWTWSVPSYGYESTVIVDANLPEEVVNDVTGFVFHHLNELRSDHPFFYRLDYDEMRDELMAPIHPGAVGEWELVDP